MQQASPNSGPLHPLRVAVFGVGGMGRNHARLLYEMDNVELVAVCDVDQAALARVSRTIPVRIYQSYHDLLDHEHIEAASVVVPTSLHYELGMALLKRGIHVLMEKPITATVQEGARLTRFATERGLVLTVGHIERFNPAVIELQRQLDQGLAGRVFQIKVRRTGPFPARIRDVGVVVDLATHDLDLILTLTGAQPLRIYAETERNIHTTHEDMVFALLRLDDGVTAQLDINWLSPFKVRELTVVGERGSFIVNYLTRELFFYENGLAMISNEAAGMEEGRMVRYSIPNVEPLLAELRAFVSAARGERPAVVSAEAGLRALAVAEAILQSAARHVVIEYRDTIPELQMGNGANRKGSADPGSENGG